MTSSDRRYDARTSMTVAFTLRIKKAFGAEVARKFAEKQQLEAHLADEILDEEGDRRQHVRRTSYRALPRSCTEPRP